jgi:hypothetical protein
MSAAGTIASVAGKILSNFSLHLPIVASVVNCLAFLPSSSALYFLVVVHAINACFQCSFYNFQQFISDCVGKDGTLSGLCVFFTSL